MQQQGTQPWVVETTATVHRDVDAADNNVTQEQPNNARLDLESQGSPLDLSSTEVTIVTMDQNVPVTLTAVVQDEVKTEL